MTINRRMFLLLAGAAFVPHTAAADESSDLQERLEKGLKARRPKEFDFIASVVALVETGRLPVKVVDATFLWARMKPKHVFQYFERALRLRLARLGIEI